MANPSTSICSLMASILQQRANSANYNVPPSRINIISPYPGHTKLQLDMRRKVEILKYNGVGQSSKTNAQTKTQLYSYLSNNAVNSNVSQYSLKYALKDINCSTNKNIPTLTTACDVPGPPMYLYNDPNVPLYNYIGSGANRTSGIINSPSPAAWSIYTTNEILYISTSTTLFTNAYTQSCEIELGSMLISTNIKESVSNFTISSPIAIWTRGLNGYSGTYNSATKTYSRPRPANVSNINISIQNVTVKVYANDALITTSSNCTQQFATVTVNPNATGPNIFYSVDYAGMLTISDLILTTQPGYNYTIKLFVNYTYDISKAKNITAFEAGIFCNLSPGNIRAFGNPTAMDDVKSVIYTSGTNVPYSNGSFQQYNNL